jgi:hypothetical protein
MAKGNRTEIGPMVLLRIVLPAAAVLAITIVAAIQTRLQGLLITGTGLLFFIVAMSLMPRLKVESKPASPAKPPLVVPKES